MKLANQSAEPRTARPKPLSVREGEGQRTWFRSGRVFKENGLFYIATREGIDVGPYDSEREASQEAERLVELLSSIHDPVKAHLVIREFRDRPKGAIRCINFSVAE